MISTSTTTANGLFDSTVDLRGDVFSNLHNGADVTLHPLRASATLAASQNVQFPPGTSRTLCVRFCIEFKDS